MAEPYNENATRKRSHKEDRVINTYIAEIEKIIDQGSSAEISIVNDVSTFSIKTELQDIEFFCGTGGTLTDVTIYTSNLGELNIKLTACTVDKSIDSDDTVNYEFILGEQQTTIIITILN